MKTNYQVIIVGGGQAGLSVAYCLKQQGIDYIIFEKGEIAGSWKNQRWDNFFLVTPNYQCRLPGYKYSGDDPYGFMPKMEIVKFVKDYAKSFDANIKEGVEVFEIKKNAISDDYDVKTTLGDFTADQVVIAAGGFHSAKIPQVASNFDDSVAQIHSSEYKNPNVLPEGEVLIVGTGQSGCQIAEDLHIAGKKVHLCVGDAPRSPRRYRGKDVVEWLEEMGYYDIPITEHPDGEKVRRKTNHYLTGRDGGKEIDLRKFAKEGMNLYGLLKDVKEGKLILGDNLKHNLDKADASYEGIKARIDEFIEKEGIDAPTGAPKYEPVWEPSEDVLELDYKAKNIKSVIWCIGYGFDFSWIKAPVFDEFGYPKYDRGVTAEEGLYFLGLGWLHTWGSGRFCGIAPDAEYIAEQIINKIKVPAKL